MRKAADVLSKLLEANTRRPGQSRPYSSVFGGWRDLVGLSLAEHSRVYEVRHGSLFVEVDHNGWMQLLLLRKARIMERLRRRYPELEIRDLRIRVNSSMPGDRPEPAGTSQGRAGASRGSQAPPGGRTGAAEGGAGAPGGPAAAPGEPAHPESAGDPGENGAGPAPAAAVERVVAQVSHQSLKESLRRLFLSSLERGNRDG
jgi:hypothetical protein